MRRFWRFRRRAPAQTAAPSAFRGHSGRRKARSVPARWSAIGGWSSWLSRILLRRFELLLELLLGATHFVDEFFKPRVIFLAVLGSQAAGDIDPVRANDANRFRDVFDFESARKNYAMSSGRATGEIPVGGLPGAAILAYASAIQKKSQDAGKLIEQAHRKTGIDAKCLDDRKRSGDARDDVGSFVAVELRGVKAHKRAQGVDVRGLGVDEHADRFDFLRQFRADLRGVGGGNAAQTFFVEIEAEGVGAGVGSGFGVGEIGDAANFDANHTGLALRRRAEKIGERGRGIAREHEMFPDEESVEAGGAQAQQIVVRAQAGFANRDTMFGDAADQLERSFRADRERFQVAIVD